MGISIIHILRYRMRGFLALAYLLSVLLLFAACSKGLQKETTVYQNDFDDNAAYINGGKLDTFNGSGVLGRYSESGFNLAITGLDTHDMIRLSFDLYIHDNWQGNAANGTINNSDIWIMDIEGANNVYTTFSNRSCAGAACDFQSYPQSFPFVNNPPYSNAIRTDLPGACALKDIKGGTSKYRIVKTIPHIKDTFTLGCYCQLNKNTNITDKNCDKSWSVDNLKIETIKFR